MSTAIERLRASKLQADQQDKARGSRHGRAWAENKAAYRTLRDLMYRRSNHPAEEPLHALKCVMDPAEFFLQEAIFEDLATTGDVDEELLAYQSDEYWQAFIDGAVGFFQEVRGEVESE